MAFASKSPKLVAGDDNRSTDVFVRDRLNRTNEMVNVSSTGALGNGPSFPNAISGDGRFVVFTSAASTFVEDDVEPGLEEALDVFLHDRQTGVTERISVNSDGEAALGPSFDSDVSDDGRFVAFESGAANLAGNDGDDTFDVFVRDRELGRTELASVGSTGELGRFGGVDPEITKDGRLVLFFSESETRGASRREVTRVSS